MSWPYMYKTISMTSMIGINNAIISGIDSLFIYHLLISFSTLLVPGNKLFARCIKRYIKEYTK